MKTTDRAVTNVVASAGVLPKNKREGGAKDLMRSKRVSLRPSRTASRPRRETNFRPIPRLAASRAAGPIVSPSREDQASPNSITTRGAPALPDLGGYRQLRLLAEAFGDAQKHRCAQENRFRHAPVNKDLTKIILASATNTEALAKKAMLECLRRVAPEVATWVRSRRGVGEHTVARLLGLIGHPAIAEPYHWQIGKRPKGHVCKGHCGKTKDGKKKHLVADPPYLRSVSQLRSYCGVGDPARRRRKLMEQGAAMRCGSVRGRMLVYLLAVAQEKSPLKSPGVYRPLYDEAKADFAERHPEYKAGHCRNHALRIVGKEILKDIWVVARKSLRLPVTVPLTEEKRA